MITLCSYDVALCVPGQSSLCLRAVLTARIRLQTAANCTGTASNGFHPGLASSLIVNHIVTHISFSRRKQKINFNAGYKIIRNNN